MYVLLKIDPCKWFVLLIGYSFSQVADDCVIINPERMAKGEYGGSFARIQVKLALEGEKWSPTTHVSAQVVKIWINLNRSFILNVFY